MAVPQPSEIAYFLAVIAAGSITRAARDLGITQPSLSEAMRRLESSVGTTLLLRSKSGIVPTRAGERFASGARHLLQQWQQLQSDIIGDATTCRGKYTIGCHSAIAHYALPKILPHLLQQFPELELEFVHEWSRKIAAGVHEQHIDIGIVINPAPFPDLVIWKVLRDRVGYWATERHKRSILIADPGLPQTQTLLNAARKKGISFERFISSTSMEFIHALGESGAGTVILPERVVRSHGDSLLQPAFRDRELFATDELTIICRQETLRTASLKVLAKTLLTMLRQQFSEDRQLA